MSTQTLTHTVTTDTAEPVTGPVLPADDRAGDGNDWMDTLDGTAWSVLPNWGSEGLGRRILAPHHLRRRPHPRPQGELFGSGTYVEGDTTTHWYRSQTPASKPSPPMCSSTGPPASPTARTTSHRGRRTAH